MFAINCYDKSTQEVFKCPLWLKEIHPNAEYCFSKSEVYYILEKLSTENEKIIYLMLGKYYKCKKIGTKMQIDALHEIHSKVDGYKKLSIFDFI